MFSQTFTFVGAVPSVRTSESPRTLTKMVSGIESKTVSPIPRSDRIVAFASVFAIVLAVAEVVVDLGTWVELDSRRFTGSRSYSQPSPAIGDCCGD